MKKILSTLAIMALYPLLWGSSITVTVPAAGEEWLLGSTHAITWTKAGDMQPTAAIRLRVAGSSEADPAALAIADGTANDGTFSWTIPATVAPGDYFIRVRTDDSTVIGDSANFRIAAAPPSISVTEPPPTAVFRARKNMRIAWTSSGISGDVRLELEKYGTAELYLVAAAHPYNGSPLDYLVPDAVPEGSYRVKISQRAMTGYSGWIGILPWVKPSLSLVAPNGGETLIQGGTFAITWNAENLDGNNICIELLHGGVLHSVLAERCNVNSGMFTWRDILSSHALLPSRAFAISPTRSEFRIRIKTLDGRYKDVSKDNFTIAAPPGISVRKPALGDIWEEDSTQEITWSAQGMEGRTGQLILVLPAGSPVHTPVVIAEGFPLMDKRYSWRVMDHAGGRYNLPVGTYPGAVIELVTFPSGGSHYASSSKPFTIRKR